MLHVCKLAPVPHAAPARRSPPQMAHFVAKFLPGNAVEKEIGGVVAVGQDAADRRRQQHFGVKPFRFEGNRAVARLCRLLVLFHVFRLNVEKENLNDRDRHRGDEKCEADQQQHRRYFVIVTASAAAAGGRRCGGLAVPFEARPTRRRRGRRRGKDALVGALATAGWTTSGSVYIRGDDRWQGQMTDTHRVCGNFAVATTSGAATAAKVGFDIGYLQG